MAWTIRIDPRAERELERLDRTAQRRITRFLSERVANLQDPRESVSRTASFLPRSSDLRAPGGVAPPRHSPTMPASARLARNANLSTVVARNLPYGTLGQALRGPLHSLWKYRVGDYRIIADLRDEELVVLIVRFGHRSTVYRR